jgi:hypothetical protein
MGYVPHLDTYPGWEVPNPLADDALRGIAPLEVVLADVMALSKLNYNSADYSATLLHLKSRSRITRNRMPGRLGASVASRAADHHIHGMFLVTEADADAIRAIFNQEGELSAVIELSRRFPGITDNAKARLHVRTIVGWKPLPSPSSSVVRLHPRGATQQSGLPAASQAAAEPAK